jgi:hypothetical protein
VLRALALAAPSQPARAESWAQAVEAINPSVWSGKSVALTSRPAGAFAVSTRATRMGQAAVFAAIHTGAGVDPKGVGRAIAEANGLEDGAAYVGRTLRADAVARYGAIAASLPTVATTETYSAKVARAAGGADLVLDVRPGLAEIHEHVTSAGQYLVTFELTVAVIDVRARTRIASGDCHGRGKELSSEDELLANDAGLLKTRLRGLWDECVVALETKMFGFARAADGAAPSATARAGSERR